MICIASEGKLESDPVSCFETILIPLSLIPIVRASVSRWAFVAILVMIAIGATMYYYIHGVVKEWPGAWIKYSN